ncbi:MAG: N-acetylmuramoyl-L-alanine amidase, partial [Ruminococcaceae bacterium]|nr:N-acetylmuramoyl-L-alanine amidase [Oscillospiraceae bacterium]
MRNLKSIVSSLLVLVMCLSVVAFQPMEAKAWGETFIIDPGHGGTDPGACAYGRQEAADVLFLSMRVGQIISSVNSVTYTRTTDVFVSLQGRCDIANGNGNAYFCSIHRNAGGGTGVETYYATNGSFASAVMAQSVNDRLAACAPWGNNRGVKTANYTVIKNTSMPAILVEVGFIDTPADNDVFVNYFEQIAQAIANGLLAMVGQSAGSSPAPAPTPVDNKLNGHSPIDLGENFVAFIRNTVTGRYITEFFGNVILADA